MADHDRTEEPTPRKLRRARERGEVPQSRLATGALVLAGVSAALVFSGREALAAWSALATRMWGASSLAPREAVAAAGQVTVHALAWPLAAAVLAGALGSALQVGPLFTAKPLVPNPGRLDPVRGLARTFSFGELGPRLGGLALALAVFALAGWVLTGAAPALAGRADLDPPRLLGATASVVGALVWRACALLAAAGVVGVVYRRMRHRREQRMSRRELRQEQRETEGEPLAKRRRVQVHRERALGPSVEEALVGAALVVRGDGVAVVLRWDERGPPEVALVARGPAAARSTALGRRARVPSAYDPWLAGELALARPLSRPALVRLARHLARSR